MIMGLSTFIKSVGQEKYYDKVYNLHNNKWTKIKTVLQHITASVLKKNIDNLTAHQPCNDKKCKF